MGLIYLVVEGLSQIALTPLLTRVYPSGEVGLWFVVTNFTVLIQIGQSGVGPVAIRRLASSLPGGREAWDNEYRTAGKAYRNAGFVLLALVILCGYYVRAASTKAGYAHGGLLWSLYGTGLIVRMYAWKWINAAISLGNVGLDKALMAASSVLCLAAYAALAAAHAPVEALATAYCIVSVAFAFSARHALKRLHDRADFHDRPVRAQLPPASEYLTESIHFSVLNISGFLVLNLDVILVERLLGAREVISFGILSKLGFLTLSVGTLIQNMIYPFLAREWSAGEHARAAGLYRRGLAISLAVTGCSAICLLLLAPQIFATLIGPGAYPGLAVSAMQLLFAVISVHTVAQALPALATGQVRFTDLALLSATLAPPLSALLGWQFGLIGIVAGNVMGTAVPSLLHGLRAYRVFHPQSTERGQ